MLPPPPNACLLLLSRNENGALIADTNCDVLAISRKRFLWALQHFPEERVAFEQIRVHQLECEIRT